MASAAAGPDAWLGAATLAVVATVALSFVAVWLTSPRRDAGIVGASPSLTPSSSALVPASSPLPQLVQTGDLPAPSSIMVSAGGAYRLADLRTGSLGGGPSSSSEGQSAMFARPGGGWLCVCGAWSGRSGGRTTTIELVLEVLDAGGASVSTAPHRTIEGRPDPSEPTERQPQVVSDRISGSGDGRFAFIGWSRRDAADGWTVGVDIIDLASLATVGERQFTLDEPAVINGRARVRTAPAVAMSPGGDAVLLSSLWYEDVPESATVPLGTDHWIVPFDGTSLGEPAPAGGTTGDVCDELDAGLLERRSADDPAYYAVCWSPNQRMLVKRMAAGGRLVDATDVPGPSGGFDGLTAVERRGDAIFIWSPDRRVLTRFDLATTEIRNSPAATGAATPSSDGPLAAIGRRVGRWLAPAALAKVILEPGIVVSPDGTRVYALGIDGPPGNDSTGSSGVFVFDAASLEPLGTWAPLADLSSLAISGDGRSVYAAALPGVDAAGEVAPFEASVTVYDTADGTVRLLAGQLGDEEVRLTEKVLR